MTKAVAKFIRMSPRKIRRVVDVIRGKSATQAETVLKFMPYSAAGVVAKVLKSAVSNAKENEKLSPEDLKVTKAFVDQAVTLKRWRAMSRGRGFPILKRTSHVTIEVSLDPTLLQEREKKEEKERKGYIPRFGMKKKAEKQEAEEREVEKQEAEKKEEIKKEKTKKQEIKKKEPKKELKKEEAKKQETKKKKKEDK
jgi:large subunit ribosomal protein L22